MRPVDSDEASFGGLQAATEDVVVQCQRREAGGARSQGTLGTRGRIRTCTEPGLSRPPLPIGLHALGVGGS